MAVELYDIVAGLAPAVLSVHLSDIPPNKPYTLDTLGEVAWTTYRPAAIDNLVREVTEAFHVAEIAGEATFNFQGPDSSTTVYSVYVVALVGSDRHLLQVFDISDSPDRVVGIGPVTYSLRIQAFESPAEEENAPQ